jgi:trimethylamine:corrinoid methyltransferase-like protein
MAERGPYLKLLSDDEIRRLHCATLDLLENVGVKFTLPEAQAIFREAGLRGEAEGVGKEVTSGARESLREMPP